MWRRFSSKSLVWAAQHAEQRNACLTTSTAACCFQEWSPPQRHLSSAQQRGRLRHPAQRRRGRPHHDSRIQCCPTPSEGPQGTLACLMMQAPCVLTLALLTSKLPFPCCFHQTLQVAVLPYYSQHEQGAYGHFSCFVAYVHDIQPVNQAEAGTEKTLPASSIPPVYRKVSTAPLGPAAAAAAAAATAATAATATTATATACLQQHVVAQQQQHSDCLPFLMLMRRCQWYTLTP